MRQAGDAGDPGMRVGYELKRAQAALRSRMDEALRPLGLTTPQYSCLDSLSRAPGQSNSDLARSVFVTRQTMNALLRSLADRGLVERAETAPRGRARPTMLTPAGRGLLSRASGQVEAVVGQMIRGLSADEAEALGRALTRCADSLDEGVPRGRV